jgi:hypothetical protein
MDTPIKIGDEVCFPSATFVSIPLVVVDIIQDKYQLVHYNGISGSFELFPSLVTADMITLI